ncbi:hypothetical protein GGX14DRAFT_389479 [Mycena pura]|uniref:Uncharacterized protein n=1 Tax=Mycena pura TaxID=153505 RepID=A0AAD6VQR0_9AGAR|nr:hypothetical protein GGX14DRAFT_389479 [Mycena pura]
MEDDFSTDTARRASPPPPPPPIWAHLYVLEKWKDFCSNSAAAIAHRPAATYDWLPSFPNDKHKKTPYDRIRQTADTIALISARDKAAGTVTACGLEGVFEDALLSTSTARSAPILYTVRLARNGKIADDELQSLRNIVDTAASAVDKVSWAELDKQDADEAAMDIVCDLLQKIVSHSKAKIWDILGKKKQRSELETWVKAHSASDLLGISPDLRDDAYAAFTAVSRPMPKLDEHQDLLDEIHARVWEAGKLYRILGTFDVPTARTSPAPPTFETTPDVTPSPPATPNTTSSSPPTAMLALEGRKFVEKLGRYFIAAKNIVWTFRYLSKLHKRPAMSMVQVEVLPVQLRTSPAADSEPTSLEYYLSTHLNVAIQTLDPDKLSSARDQWASASGTVSQLFHAELQLAMFYAVHPELVPMGGRLQKSSIPSTEFEVPEADSRYSPEATGPPLLFTVRGTHGGLALNWQFPTVDSKGSLTNAAYAKVCARLNLVRQELSTHLCSRVQVMIPHVADKPKNRRADESDGVVSEDSAEYVFRMMRAKKLRQTVSSRVREIVSVPTAATASDPQTLY